MDEHIKGIRDVVNGGSPVYECKYYAGLRFELTRFITTEKNSSAIIIHLKTAHYKVIQTSEFEHRVFEYLDCETFKKDAFWQIIHEILDAQNRLGLTAHQYRICTANKVQPC